MNPKPATLDQVERWMQSIIMHPGGVAEAVASAEARRHLDVGLADLESVITRSRSLDAASRLEIYVDAYYERLFECLREEFAATRRALGSELFDAVAFGYLRHCPSRSYTLNLLGAAFPGYLAESRLHERGAPSGAAPTWGDFVVELATFERLLRDVFDGPGTEGCDVLEEARLAAIPPERWGSLRLVAAPCLRLTRFAHPVHAYWSAAKAAAEPPEVRPEVVHLAISRRAFVVEYHELSRTQFELLSRLAQGGSLEAALAEATALAAHEAAELERGVGDWFRAWTRDRFFVGLEVG